MAGRASDYAVLGMLTLGPMSGYDIRRNVAVSIAHFWSESYGQIYPTLKRLEAEGLARKDGDSRAGGRLRQQYAITAKGRKRLAAWLASEPRPRPPRSELLLKLFFARALPSGVSRRHLQRFQAVQEARLRQYDEVERWLHETHARHPSLPYWFLTLDYGRREAKALAEWAAEADKRLSSLTPRTR
jgi:PadR family transcriptional regulator AphA